MSIESESSPSLSVEDALVSGLPIAGGESGRCDRCHGPLRENHAVEVVVRVTKSGVTIPVCRCRACASGELPSDDARTDAGHHWLARGRALSTVDSRGRPQLILSAARLVKRTAP